MRNILFGLFFILFDFNITLGAIFFSLIPDFVGYALIYRSLGGMAPHSVRFERLEWIAKYMVAYSAVYYFLQLVGYLPTVALPLRTIFELINVVMRLYIIYQILCGVRDIEDAHATYLGGDKAFFYWRLIAIAHLLMLVLGWLLPALTGAPTLLLDFLSILALISVYGGFILSILLIVRFYSIQKQYTAAGLTP